MCKCRDMAVSISCHDQADVGNNFCFLHMEEDSSNVGISTKNGHIKNRLFY